MFLLLFEYYYFMNLSENIVIGRLLVNNDDSSFVIEYGMVSICLIIVCL